MILKETILSAFTERGTLLKWLKKVEAALNNAVLTDVSVEQISTTQVKLKFTFENGDYVESPVLTLPRGEKGEPGKDGLDGEGIAATIEVGTVTTGAPGTNASVTNVGTEQNAILNFVIPRGATGEAGAEGGAGVGFEDADSILINDGAVNITAGDNGVNIEASFEVAVGEEILEIPSAMYLPLKGSESIVIDVDKSGKFIDIHLDADIAAKIGRALVTPMVAPESVAIVGVDTGNAQIMLKIGNGLRIRNGFIELDGPVSDLTGTTWNVPSGWQAPSQKFYYVNAIFNGISINGIFFGTRYGDQYYASPNELVYRDTNGTNNNLLNTQSFTVSFNSGEDINDADLISWLYEYGELQE